MFDSMLNPIFAPLLKLPILWAIIIVALVIAVLITFVYKWMTDQHLMKTLKEDMKNFQKQMKEFKAEPKRVMELQKRAMETNMKYMMHSFKPTLITFIPLIIIFGWLNANLAFVPIMPDTEFTTTAIFDKETTGTISLVVPEQLQLITDSTPSIVDNQAQWKLKGPAGEYILEYVYNDQSYNKELLITEQQKYKQPLMKVKDSALNMIQTDHNKIKPLNLFGWKVGWLGTYIIFSIAFSMILRKILKLH